MNLIQTYGHFANTDQIKTNDKSRPWIKYICHQRPERCFTINGKPMPICSRCLGFYLGLFLGGLLPFMIIDIYYLDANYLLLIMLISITPMAIDGLTQLLGFRTSNNYLRFSSGLLSGIILGIIFNWLLIHILILD